MKKVLQTIVLVLVLIVAFLIGRHSAGLHSKSKKLELEAKAQKEYEKTYFWAQVDAREGLWRVSDSKENKDYSWIGTPNRSGNFPIYEPTEDVINYINFYSQTTEPRLESVELIPLEDIKEKAVEMAKEIKEATENLLEPKKDSVE